MGELVVSVRKLTDIELMHSACETTSGLHSGVSLSGIYKSEHSPARTQLFWITLENVKLFVASHFVRHHVGSVPFQLTQREDRRKGGNTFLSKCDSIVGKLDEAVALVNDGKKIDTAYKIIEAEEALRDLWKTSDRNTRVNLSILVNAQSLIDMAKLRLCKKSHVETIKAFECIKTKIKEVDSSLAELLVKKCVYRGGICGELKCCGYNKTQEFKVELGEYMHLFS